MPPAARFRPPALALLGVAAAAALVAWSFSRGPQREARPAGEPAVTVVWADGRQLVPLAVEGAAADRLAAAGLAAANDSDAAAQVGVADWEAAQEHGCVRFRFGRRPVVQLGGEAGPIEVDDLVVGLSRPVVLAQSGDRYYRFERAPYRAWAEVQRQLAAVTVTNPDTFREPHPSFDHFLARFGRG
jgi:hypothetical protein